MSKPDKDPRDLTERFSIGTILVKQQVLTRKELEEMVDLQRRMSADELLGDILVRRGMITPGQLDAALSTQRGLRSKKPHERALAAAELAVTSAARITHLSEDVNEAVKQIHRKRISSNYPTVKIRKSDVE